MYFRDPTRIDGEVEVVRTFLSATESPVNYHHDALSYWDTVRGDWWAPGWSDISLMDFPPRVVPLISVTDINPEPLESTYRFWGTKLTKYHGGDYTGISPTKVPPRELGMSNTGGCGRLVSEKKPHLEVKAFKTQIGTLGRALVLRLPLSDNGETVNHGINIYYFETADRNQPQADFFNRVFEKLP